jgi:NADH-quinone oxidoreductase subunit D
MTLEKLLILKFLKERNIYRVIVMELARITDHIINSILGDTERILDFYMCSNLEKSMRFMKKFVVARLTTNMGRIGGFERDWSQSI